MSEMVNSTENKEELIPMNEESSEELDFASEFEKSFKTLNTGDRVTGIVAAVYPNEIQVDLGTKQSGYIPSGEYTDDPNADLKALVKPGDELELFVVRVNDVEGTIMLSKRRIDSLRGWDIIEAAVEDKTVFEGKVLEAVKGGLVALVNGVRVFVPASHVSSNRNVELADYVGKQYKMRILETEKRRRRVIASIKLVAREARKEIEEKFFAEAAVGQEFEGTVKSLTSYGAFVDLGGVDGMVHISELSWSKLRNPAELVNVGDSLKVVIKEIDPEKKRISLSHKALIADPWNTFISTYNVGDVASVTVQKMMPFGAFASVIPGVDGLIHISQIADRRIAKPQDVLTVGQVVDAKIVDIDLEKKKISLSIRALLQPAEAVETEEVAEAEENA